MSDDDLVIAYAVRYCLSRSSWTPSDDDWLVVRYWDVLDEAIRSDVIARIGRQPWMDDEVES